MNHFVMTCADGVMKSCDAISVGFAGIVHLGGGVTRSELRNHQALFHFLNFKRKKSSRTIAMFLVTLPIVINVPSRGLLAVETMHVIV